MKNIPRILLLSLLMCIIFIFTFLKSPDQIRSMLNQLTTDMYKLSIVMHGIYLLFFVLGFIFRKLRNALFSALLLILSATASIISIKYLIIPNILIFVTFFALTLIALIKKELDFDFTGLKLINKVIGFTAIFFAFYYLHWVEKPIFLNALVYSPLGIVNCPTMVAFCGFLCFLKKPGTLLLEFFVASVTLYFGFFGVMRLGAYVDIVLIAAAIFLIIRKASLLNINRFYY